MSDALLILSFGGPEGPGDVLPFLRTVTRGRNVPDERLAVVAEQYELFGGRSPINAQCRALKAAVEVDFAANDVDLPVYWGNRNWHPFVADTVAEMAADGVTRALVFVTSAFGSYSGCRQYREDLAAAAADVGDGAPTLDKLRLYFNHPGFIEPMAANMVAAVDKLRAAGDNWSAASPVRLVFTAHSIPTSMAAGCDYEAQLRDAAQLVIASAGLDDGAEGYDLVFQSRSGPPSVPWLEPDINDHLATLAQEGVERVVVVPIGFVSDHMEVLFDLDTQAAATADELGISMMRAATVGTDRRFVAMIRALVTERLAGATPVALGSRGPWPNNCPPDHCPPPAPRRSSGPPT